MADTRDTKIDRLRRWRAGETPGPWDLVVMPTNRCNLKCAICWAREAEKVEGKALYDRRHEVTDDRWLALVDEAAALGVREWNVVGAGEPMVRGDLVMTMCERIRNRGMSGLIQTNGTLLTPDHFNRLIDVEWPRIAVSLDGPGPDVNDAIRSPGSFARATENVRRLNQLRRQRGAKHPEATLHLVLTRLNYDQLEQMIELAHDLACSALGLVDLLVEGEEAAGFALTDQQKTALPAHLRRAIAAADRLDLPTNLASFLSTGTGDGPRAANPGKANGNGGPMAAARCLEPWLGAAIRVDGSVGPCCVFSDEDADSIRDKSLKDVWLGPYLERVRQQIAATGTMAYCRHCPTGMPARTADLRQQERWRAMGLAQRAAYLTKRFGSHLHRHGLRKTLRRTRAWAQSHRR